MRPLVLMLLSPFAAADNISCPLELPAEVITVRAPQGWLATVPSLLRLTDGGVMRGHPNEKGYLVPDRTSSTKKGGTRTYMLDRGEERWLWCSYGSLSPQLTRRLDDATTECTLTYEEAEDTGLTQMEVSCRPPNSDWRTDKIGTRRTDSVLPSPRAGGKPAG